MRAKRLLASVSAYLIVSLFAPIASSGLGAPQTLAAGPTAEPGVVSDSAQVTKSLNGKALSSASSGPLMFIENVGQFAADARFRASGGQETIWLAEDAIWVTLLTSPSASPPPLQEDGTTSPPSLPGKGAGGLGLEGDGGSGLVGVGGSGLVGAGGSGLVGVGGSGLVGAGGSGLVEVGESGPSGVNLKLSFPGANPHPRLVPFDRLDTHVSYFIGSDPKQWRPDVPAWGGVRYVDLYPGVDLVMSGQNGKWRWQLITRDANTPLARQAPDSVHLRIEGAESMSRDEDELYLFTEAGTVALQLPATSLPLDIEGSRLSSPSLLAVNNPSDNAPTEIARSTDAPEDLIFYTRLCPSGHPLSGQALSTDSLDNAYVIRGYQFTVTKLSADGTEEYCRALAPTGSFNPDEGYGIAVDASGYIYVTGIMFSRNAPTTPGAFDTTQNGWSDVYVAKLTPDGKYMVYGTFIGGHSDDEARGIVVDPAGNAYVTGWKLSDDFPVTADPLGTAPTGSFDVFVSKLNRQGTHLAFSVTFGGIHADRGNDILLDPNGNIYIAGLTNSPDFPTTPTALDRSFNGEWDAFIAKIDPGATQLLYATLLGGSRTENATAITLDPQGNLLVTGSTSSADFPVTMGAFDTTYHKSADAFVAKLALNGEQLIYATRLGGRLADFANDITVDRIGRAYITGYTDSQDFPVTIDAFDTTRDSAGDGFMAKLSADGSSLEYATFLDKIGLGSEGAAIALDRGGRVLIAGGPMVHSGSYPSYVAKLVAGRRTFQAVRTGAPPTIDGDIGEWQGLGFQVLNENTANYIEQQVPDPDDLSANLRVAWAPDTLYIAAAITDDTLVGHDSLDLWNDDTLDIGIRVAPGNVHHFSLCVDGRQADHSVPIDALTVVTRTMPGGWQLEAAIPISALGSGTLTVGQTYPFNFALWDDDLGHGSDSQTHMFWQSDSTSTYQPDWGTLSLSDEVFDFPPATATPTPTATATATTTPTATNTPTITPTTTPTITPTPTVTPTITPTPTSTPTPVIPGTISGMVWYDLNGNRVRDAGEPGLINVTVELWNDESKLGQTKTLGNGFYSFTALLPGRTYRIQEINPSWIRYSTTPDEATITLSNGEQTTVNFGDWNGLPNWLPLVTYR